MMRKKRNEKKQKKGKLNKRINRNKGRKSVGNRETTNDKN